MEYILYIIIVLFVGCFYAKTAKKLREQGDRIIQLSIEIGRLKELADEKPAIEMTDYEKFIQQGVENLMGYSVEKAMKSRGGRS